MNRKAFVVFLLVAALVTGLGSCKSTPKVVEPPTADWVGVYTGTTPGADGSINVRLTLNQDLTFELQYEYVDKDGDPVNWTGSFQLDEGTGIVTLQGVEEAPAQYKVADSKVIQLDLEGNEITGDLAESYILQKE